MNITSSSDSRWPAAENFISVMFCGLNFVVNGQNYSMLSLFEEFSNLFEKKNMIRANSLIYSLQI